MGFSRIELLNHRIIGTTAIQFSIARRCDHLQSSFTLASTNAVKKPRSRKSAEKVPPVQPSNLQSPFELLHAKVALITGATQGIGLATARALAEEGCNLILCGRDQGRLASAEGELARKGTRVVAIGCDVREEKSVAAMVAKVRRAFSRIDILINSAGIANAFRPVAELDVNAWNDVLATNLTGTFLATRAALPLMSRGGSIVNVLSMSSKRAFPNLAAYNASKFGALGFTNTLREELRSEGIRVIAVLPGATDTAIWDKLWPEAPRHKMIRPETVAQAIVATLNLPPESTVEELDLMPTGGPL
jgi:NAD(P)-dependent dehydrogenase (short-subunit alcohol dehydrogenase family)